MDYKKGLTIKAMKILDKNKKLSIGIIILNTFIILGSILGILGDLGTMFLGELVVESYDGKVIQSTVSNAQLIIDIILRIIFIISAILILMKKSLGIYSCFVAIIISIITSIIFNGFSIAVIFSLIILLLIIIFILKKR
ncbi:MAG: hypothetical protein MSA89_06150 [Clostridium sp.]|nr:hypothetical protein [Clostridium sp.]MCI7442652.1 hypothetical protein [Clostridium sp.]